jgi:hypothetical protein
VRDGAEAAAPRQLRRPFAAAADHDPGSGLTAAGGDEHALDHLGDCPPSLAHAHARPAPLERLGGLEPVGATSLTGGAEGQQGLLDAPRAAGQPVGVALGAEGGGDAVVVAVALE